MTIAHTIYYMNPVEITYTFEEYDAFTLKELAAKSEEYAITFQVYGNEHANYVVGNRWDNGIDGGLGADTLIGGAGDDHYRIHDLGDVVIEHANEGIDSIGSFVSYKLPANVENLFLYGSGATVFTSYENLDGTGNALDNTLGGTAGNNYLSGLEGNDTLYDVGGIDTLEGGAGNDRYYVDSQDSLVIEYDNGGNDTVFIMYHVDDLRAFNFSKFKNVEALHFGDLGSKGYTVIEDGELYLLDDMVGAKSKAKKLTDFNVKQDAIGMSKAVFSKVGKKGALKKDAFWTGSKAHDSNDRVVYDKKTGALYYDADGSGSQKAVKLATLDKHLKMTATDFFVI